MSSKLRDKDFLSQASRRQSLYYSPDSTDTHSSPSPPRSEFMPIPGSPIPNTRLGSPTASVPDLTPDSSADDHFAYTADTYSTLASNALSMSYPSSDTSIGSYGSLLDASPMSSFPSHGHRSETDQTSFHPVYRLMPASQSSSMSDVSIPTAGLYQGVESYHPYHEQRIRSPVPFF